MYNTLIHQIKIAINSRFKVINLRHEKKLIKFRKNQQKIRKYTDPGILRSTVHNCSSYTLTTEEMNALAFGLNHHIPTKTGRNTLRIEYEMFFQNLLKDITHIPENEVGQIKTKLLNVKSTFEKYSNAKVPNYQKKDINNLPKRENIIIMKQDKDRGFVIMDKTKYTEKLPIQDYKRL